MTYRGDLTEHHASAQEAERSTAEAMQKGVASLADALDKPAPVLPPAATQQTAAASSVDILFGKVGKDCCYRRPSRLFFLSFELGCILVFLMQGCPAVKLSEMTSA